MFDFIKKLFFNNEENKELEKENLIHLINYHYKVNSIYGNMIFVDVDIDTCEVENGHPIKLLNEIYILANKEFLPHKKDFRWRLTLVKDED